MSYHLTVRRLLTRGGISALACLAGLGLAAGSASAELVALEISLDQAQGAPAPQAVDGAQGLGVVIVNTDTSEISWAISYEGLSGASVGAHFHGPAGPGASAGVAVDMGGVSGLGTNLVGTAQISGDQMEQLLSGAWYVNVHTELNKPGEIRGQVVGN